MIGIKTQAGFATQKNKICGSIGKWYPNFDLFMVERNVLHLTRRGCFLYPLVMTNIAMEAMARL